LVIKVLSLLFRGRRVKESFFVVLYMFCINWHQYL
jgi:hypothetical protein